MSAWQTHAHNSMICMLEMKYLCTIFASTAQEQTIFHMHDMQKTHARVQAGPHMQLECKFSNSLYYKLTKTCIILYGSLMNNCQVTQEWTVAAITAQWKQGRRNGENYPQMHGKIFIDLLFIQLNYCATASKNTWSQISCYIMDRLKSPKKYTLCSRFKRRSN